jgi:DNA processing protein
VTELIALGPADRRYPRRLLDLAHPPDPLWVRGDVAVARERAVSIVGTRRATSYGLRVARELAAATASAGIVVVSGLAQGIDSAAHEGAVEAGRTVGVLGAGIGAYLAQASGRRRRLAAEIGRAGALVAEYPPDASAKDWMFARRNATIAALGEAVVVVEAPEGSGALITAAEARRLRRPLFAVPGPIGVLACAGSNALIASGAARALTGSAMLLTLLGVGSPEDVRPTDRDAVRILDALAASAADPDALAKRVGLAPAALARALARLVLSGEVRACGDGRFARR